MPFALQAVTSFLPALRHHEVKPLRINLFEKQQGVLMRLTYTTAAIALFWAMGCASIQAQSIPSSPVQALKLGTIAHLSASATTRVLQDWLMIRLSVQKEGAEAAMVQRQVNTTLAAALAQAQSEAKQNDAKPGAMELSTGQLNVSQRYNREGKTSGWLGTAELIVQGRDIDRITATAARLNGLTVSQVEWQISPELMSQSEAHVQSQAVAQWRTKANALTQQLGMSRYSIDDVTLSTQDNGQGIGPRVTSMVMRDPGPDARSAALSVQASQSQVTVVVSGQILLQ
jgi:predicted secreted protein